MKFLTSIAIVLFLLFCSSSSSAEEIPCECKISNTPWEFFQFKSTCAVKAPFRVINENTTIATINGYTQPNEKVRFFYVFDKVAYYIPKGLNSLFTKLTGLKFDQTSLKLVVKEDLQPFPDLLMFSSNNNKIEFLEKDLFIYNSKLQFVSFTNNKITYIDPNVFEVISSTLAALLLDGTAIDCDLASATDPKGITKMLNKIPKSACAKIENSPPLYASWLKMKEEIKNNADCDELIAAKESECDEKMNILEHEYSKFLTCALDPSSPNCSEGASFPNK